MYLLSGIFLLLCMVFFFLYYHRKKYIIQKLCRMDICEKQRILNDLAKPFGFRYLCSEDIITSAQESWQRKFGYCTLFDQAAPRFNMVFDCEPIYFSYGNRTWLIEFWKGQYGINIGGEIGVYRADTVIPPEKYSSTVFHAVSDAELLPLAMELFYRNQSLFAARQQHWWLTGFYMGGFSRPEDLIMSCSVTFPNQRMLQSFLAGMAETGYGKCELNICNLTVTFLFSEPRSRQPRTEQRFLVWWALLKNRLFCQIYCRMTRPFSCTRDKLLYLYYFLPAACRHMLRLRRIPKR